MSSSGNSQPAKPITTLEEQIKILHKLLLVEEEEARRVMKDNNNDFTKAYNQIMNSQIKSFLNENK
ncbi:hypothetical protein TVAG_282080 [Trichomonas vaginalis G3]|uniref:Uncharacterized protein n=1 Tax=Trichomonas vaginalis (strain ATCC PRA-98 / G3) TaxID=412133 RepID=A2E9S3_TRIV3|nr:UBA-like family [Trichomonas vaginalis G3]EAY10608.1 hypothetical protein TVAG_282080 [Trichomonas vaginalis G3]KAI5540860.1 UBA-like family [Trichomonas vaginalis G3]|eukprot:XP_001322831.1 hypothetical protein [Trichomonas vaginalis G3]